MSCTCGGSSNCGNCGRTYTCSCTGVDVDPADIKCTDGEPCDIVLDAGCVTYTHPSGAVGQITVQQALDLIFNADTTVVLSWLTQIANTPALKTALCNIVNSC